MESSLPVTKKDRSFNNQSDGFSPFQNENVSTRWKQRAGIALLACMMVVNYQNGMAADPSPSKDDQKVTKSPPLPPSKGEGSSSKPAGLPPAPSVKKAEPPLKKPQYLQVGQFIVNLKGEKHNQYLKIKVHLLMSEPKAVEYLSKRLAEVKDVIRGELENLRSEDLQQADKREELRQLVKAKVSQLFPQKKEKRPWKDPQPIKKVLFEELVVQ